jgi:protein-tyrosine phosphatase
MIDIHSHFLCGIDDGARTLDMSEKMLEQAVEAGIKGLFATPHVNRHTSREMERLIQCAFDEMQDYVLDRVLPIQLALSAEVHVNADHAYLVSAEWPLIGTNQKYLLLELPLRGIPEKMSQIIFDLGMQGIKTIMAHPERNQQLQEDPGWMVQWYNQGCLMQMDAGSITGQFGRQCREFSIRLLRHKMIHCIASDAHNDSSRSYFILKQAHQILKDHLPGNYVDDLFILTPERFLKGEKIENKILELDMLDETFLQRMKRFLKYGL